MGNQTIYAHDVLSRPRVLPFLVGGLMLMGSALSAENAQTEPKVKDSMKTKALVDFENPEESKQWSVVNDGVMGGLSQSGVEITSAAHALFAGKLSLENNGGFASIRRKPHDYGLNGYDGILLRVKGDGRTYQFRVRTNDRFDGVSYRAEFKTKPEEWMTAKIPFKSLKPTFRGRPVPSAPELRPDRIRQIGFLLGDKREGRFQIEIDWIQTYRLQGSDERPSEKPPQGSANQ